MGREAEPMFLESGNPGSPKQQESCRESGPVFLASRNPGILKQRELVEMRDPCCWSSKIQEFKNRGTWLRGRAHVPGVLKSRNPKTTGIQEPQNKRNLAERQGPCSWSPEIQ